VETCALLYVEDGDSRASSGRRYVGRASPFVVYRVAEEEQAMALLNRSGICVSWRVAPNASCSISVCQESMAGPFFRRCKQRWSTENSGDSTQHVLSVGRPDARASSLGGRR